MSLWVKPDRNDLKIEDLITNRSKNDRLGTAVTYTDVVYNQHMNQLCRYPELLFMFQEHCLNSLDWNAFHNTIKVKLDHRSTLDLMKDVLPVILGCFRDNKNIAIDMKFGSIELRASTEFINEDFEDYRVGCIATIHKYLGLSLHGYGNYLYEYKFKDGTLARHITNPPKFETMTKEQLKLLYEILETKNSWGKNEIKTLVLEISAGIRTEV